MSGRETKFPKKKVPTRSHHSATTIVGKNGLVVDSLATIEPGTTMIPSVDTGVSYTSPTVTVNAGVDLSVLVDFVPGKGQHTGELLFTDATGQHYYIDHTSVNNTTKTFDIYIEEALTTSPTSIDTGSGWFSSEAELVNRLQTTSSAVIDSVEFRDVDVKLTLDGREGDCVRICDEDGDELDIEPDGSINVNVEVDAADGDSILIKDEDGDTLEINDKGDARVVDTLTCGGKSILVTVTDTPIEIKVAATAKSDRKCIFVQPRAKGLYWSFESNVTADDAITGGAPLGKNQPMEIDAEITTPVYLVGPVTGVKVFISEA